MSRIYRAAAWLTLTCFVAGLGAPAVQAQDASDQIGDVIGTTGSASIVPKTGKYAGTELGAAPIYNRPTAGQIKNNVGNLVDQAHLKTINARIGADGQSGLYNNMANRLGTTAETAGQAAATLKGTQWVKWTSRSGNTFLRPRLPNGQFGKGSIPVPKGLEPGTPQFNEFVASNAALRNSAFNITKELMTAQNQLKACTSAKGRAILQNRITDLQAKQTAIQNDIKAYNENTPASAKTGAQLKAVATSAAKWAAVSAAVTVGANVITQLSANGWDPTKVDWGAAAGQLMTKEFWGGTIGSFLGSYGASLIASALPGGPFVKALFAVGGAAIGYQAGTGNLGNTDWTQLGVTTVGSTVGMLIGQAICPIPGVGAILGGIAGHIIADQGLKLFRKLMGKKDEASQAAADPAAQAKAEADARAKAEADAAAALAAQEKAAKERAQYEPSREEILKYLADQGIYIDEYLAAGDEAGAYDNVTRATEELTAAQRGGSAQTDIARDEGVPGWDDLPSRSK